MVRRYDFSKIKRCSAPIYTERYADLFHKEALVENFCIMYFIYGVGIYNENN